MDKRFCVFFSPQKFLCTIGYHPNNYIIEDLGHMGYSLEKMFVFFFFNEGLIRHLIIWETLHFQGFNMDMAF